MKRAATHPEPSLHTTNRRHQRDIEDAWGKVLCKSRIIEFLPFIKQLRICSKKRRDLRRAPKSEDIATAMKDVGIDDVMDEDRNPPMRKAGRLRVASDGFSDGFPSIASKRAGGTADIGDNRSDRYGGRNFPTEDILALTVEEVRKYAMDLKTDHRCALCPFRSFSRPWRVREHLEIYHTAENRWCASGMKQLRTFKALYDHDKKTSRPGRVFAHAANYTRRSADIIRSDIALCSAVSDLDMDASKPVGSIIRIAHRASGPVFFHVDYLDSGAGRFRRMGYGIKSDDFYNEAARQAMDHQGRVQKVQGEMRNLCKNGLAAFQPKFIEVWEAIACDIFFSYVG